MLCKCFWCFYEFTEQKTYGFYWYLWRKLKIRVISRCVFLSTQLSCQIRMTAENSTQTTLHNLHHENSTNTIFFVFRIIFVVICGILDNKTKWPNVMGYESQNNDFLYFKFSQISFLDTFQRTFSHSIVLAFCFVKCIFISNDSMLSRDWTHVFEIVLSLWNRRLCKTVSTQHYLQ